MNIAIASETEEIDGLVPATFKESPFLMIIDADKNQIFQCNFRMLWMPATDIVQPECRTGYAGVFVVSLLLSLLLPKKKQAN
jgi:hypothetical protein